MIMMVVGVWLGLVVMVIIDVDVEGEKL